MPKRVSEAGSGSSESNEQRKKIIKHLDELNKNLCQLNPAMKDSDEAEADTKLISTQQTTQFRAAKVETAEASQRP